MSGEGAPFTQDVELQVAAADTAVDVLGTTEAPFAGTLTAAQVIPVDALTGAATNSRTITVTNRGQAGAGTAVMATTAFVSGINLVAEDPFSLTLSGTPANLVVAEGDVIEVASLHIGTGLAAPQFDCELTFSRVSGS